jgi:WD40 repeat protein
MTTTTYFPRKVAPILFKDGTPKLIYKYNSGQGQIYGACIVKDYLVGVCDSHILVVAKLISIGSKINDNDDDDEPIILDSDNTDVKFLANVHHESVTRYTKTRDDEYFISVDYYGVIIVWETTNWTIVRRHTLDKAIWGLEINHDETRLICGLNNANVIWLDFHDFTVKDIDRKSHQHSILAIARHSSEDRFVVGGGSTKGEISVFDCSISDKLIRIFNATISSWVGGVAFIGDQLISGGTSEDELHVWDISLTSTTDNNNNNDSDDNNNNNVGSNSKIATVKAFDAVRSLAVSADHSLLAAGVDEGKIVLYKLPELELKQVLNIHYGHTSVSFSKDMAYLVTGDDKGVIMVHEFKFST